MKAILGLTLCALISTHQLHQQEAPITPPEKPQQNTGQNKNQLSIDKVVIMPIAVFTKPIIVNVFAKHRHPHGFGRFGRGQFSAFGGYSGRPFSSPFSSDDNEDDSESRFRSFGGQNLNRDEQNSADQQRQNTDSIFKSLKIIRLKADNDSENKEQSSDENQKKQEVTETSKQTKEQAKQEKKQQEKKQQEKPKEQIKLDLPLVIPINSTETATAETPKTHLFDEDDEYY